MSEDYTWTETTPHGYAMQNAELKAANTRLAARVQELERRLARVQDFADYYYGWQTGGELPMTFDDWCAFVGVDSEADDPDAPLTVARIDDEDSDL